MSISEKILELLQTPTFKYKGLPVNCFGLPIFREYHKQSIRNSVSQLHFKKFIITSNGNIEITKKGKQYIKKKHLNLEIFEASFEHPNKKNLLLLFDIPEERRHERGWLRRHLRKFGYSMVQKSVWVGPSPLPKEFVAYIKKIKLGDSIKTFKLATSYLK